MDAVRRFWRRLSTKGRLGVFLLSSTLLLCACSIIVLMVAEEGEDGHLAEETPWSEESTPPWAADAMAEAADAADVDTGPAYAEIRRLRGVLTDEEWGRAARGLVGTWVQWTGYVASIDARGELAVEMDPLAWPSGTPDVYLTVSPDDASWLAQEQVVVFIGRIRRITDARDEVTVVLRDGAIVW